MINKKTYYSISEVSKMIGIQEHTIRFWDTKLEGLSRRSEKGRTRFFNQQQINKLVNINNLLKSNDSLTLAYKIINKDKFTKTASTFPDLGEKDFDSTKNSINTTKIKIITKNLKDLLND